MSEAPNLRRANRLAREASAYLRQHMYNPVDWHGWGEEALAIARREDKPLLISIGYSACHWCHVMERESFEDAATAELMNRLFVNIKVDREERPDLDQIYMDTVVQLTGHGGWPLTVFCTPEGRPFYGGTYFPPEPRHHLPSFRQVLSSVDEAYRDRRGEVDRGANRIAQALSQRPRGVARELPGPALLAVAAAELMKNADRESGGFGAAPKFPTPTNLEMLLAALDHLPEAQAGEVLDHCLLTCREMSRRGLYDHLGGGFHRYCVDGSWTIPHFEKMLYDQGLLLRVYLETWRRSGASDEELLWPVRETVEYLRRDMRGSEGGFCASQDADSEGQEGRYYVWRREQIEPLLGERTDAFCDAYSVAPEGNFEEGATHLVDRARAPRSRFAEERTELLAARTQRIPPQRDGKRVTAWNGYAVSGLARSGSLLEEESMLEEAARAADFLLAESVDDRGRLMRVFDGGRASVSGFLDDHASLLDACLDLYRAGAGERFLAAALHLAEEIATRFFDREENDLFLTPSDGEQLVVRPRSDHDGATPQAAGLATLGLVRSATLAGRDDLQEIADRVIRSYAFLLERTPWGFPTLLRAVAASARGLSVAVVAGDPAAPATRALAQRARRVLAPEDAVVVAAPGAKAPEGLAASWLEGREAREGAPTAYLCRGRSCSLPITDPEKLQLLASAGASEVA
jgi:uncharacterized protein YyaL (SSP411 family)